MGEHVGKSGQDEGARHGTGEQDDDPGLEWFADSPFIQELAEKLTRSLRLSRILGALAGAALVALIAALFYVAWMGLQVARMAEILIAARGAEAGAKNEASQKPDAPALPLPDEPLPGQLRAPCPKPYIEASGGCWDVFESIDRDGKRRPCPANNPLIREMKDEHGQWRCYSAVIRPSKNAEKPGKGTP